MLFVKEEAVVQQKVTVESTTLNLKSIPSFSIKECYENSLNAFHELCEHDFFIKAFKKAHPSLCPKFSKKLWFLHI